MSGIWYFKQPGILVQFNSPTGIIYWHYRVGITVYDKNRSTICLNSLVWIHITEFCKELSSNRNLPYFCGIWYIGYLRIATVPVVRDAQGRKLENQFTDIFLQAGSGQSSNKAPLATTQKYDIFFVDI